MTQEEKAQRYDEAIKIAKDSFNYPSYPGFIRADVVFPELKESEDEMIRKWIIENIQETLDVDGFFEGQKTMAKNAIAWLEKQGEKDEEILILEDQIESLHAAIKAIKETHRIELEKLGKSNMGISEATKQKLEDSLNKALEKETSESFNKFLDEQGKQKEINLVKILKHYPKETELYSPLYGKLWLAEVDEENEIITCYKYPLNKGCTRAILEQEDTVSFYSNGTTGLLDFNISKDCMLFLYDIEKQGKQKPKFRVSDTIKCKYDDRQFTIKSVDLDKGTYTYTQEGCGNDIDYADEEFELVEQNPAWSEEDEKMLKACTELVGSTICANYGEEDGVTIESCRNWLKSLKERYTIIL